MGLFRKRISSNARPGVSSFGDRDDGPGKKMDKAAERLPGEASDFSVPPASEFAGFDRGNSAVSTATRTAPATEIGTTKMGAISATLPPATSLTPTISRDKSSLAYRSKKSYSKTKTNSLTSSLRAMSSGGSFRFSRSNSSSINSFSIMRKVVASNLHQLALESTVGDPLKCFYKSEAVFVYVYCGALLIVPEKDLWKEGSEGKIGARDALSDLVTENSKTDVKLVWIITMDQPLRFTLSAENTNDVVISERDDSLQENEVANGVSFVVELKFRSSGDARSFVAVASHAQWNLDKRSKKVTFQDFEYITKIGRGGFASVYLVRFRLTGELMAMKVTSKKDKDDVWHQVANERHVLEMCRGEPFCLQLRFAIQTSSMFALVTEFLGGGELVKIMQKYGRECSVAKSGVVPEDHMRQLSSEIFLGIKSLHSKRILWRDLKPENILLDLNGHARLADFGVAKELHRKMKSARGFVGTRTFMAPEMLKLKSHAFPCDIWSFGVLLFAMTYGRVPVEEQHLVKGKYQSAPILYSNAKTMPDGLLDLMRGCLTEDAEKRWSLEKIQNCAYFSSVDWPSVRSSTQRVAADWEASSQDFGKTIVSATEQGDIESVLGSRFDLEKIALDDGGFDQEVRQATLRAASGTIQIGGANFVQSAGSVGGGLSRSGTSERKVGWLKSKGLGLDGKRERGEERTLFGFEFHEDWNDEEWLDS